MSINPTSSTPFMGSPDLLNKPVVYNPKTISNHPGWTLISDAHEILSKLEGQKPFTYCISQVNQKDNAYFLYYVREEDHQPIMIQFYYLTDRNLWFYKNIEDRLETDLNKLINIMMHWDENSATQFKYVHKPTPIKFG